MYNISEMCTKDIAIVAKYIEVWSEVSKRNDDDSLVVVLNQAYAFPSPFV